MSLNFNNGPQTPVTDLPSGQPPSAPAGFTTPAGGADLKLQTMVNGSQSGMSGLTAPPPSGVIFKNAPAPWPVVLQGFDFQTLSMHLRSYEVGNTRYIVRIWNQMRKRDEHLLSVSQKRLKRVARLDWEITPADSSPEATRQAEYLSNFFQAIKVKKAGNSKQTFGLKKALRHLMSAVANGFAACEIEWLPGQLTVSADSADQADSTTADDDVYQGVAANLILIRSDFFDASTGELNLFADSSLTAQAIPIPENKLIVHEDDEPLMIAGSILFVMKQIALGQWNQFCDRFGMPGMVGTAPQGASTASAETLQKVVENWVSTMATVLPPGYDIKTVAAAMSGSVIPAAAMVEHCDDAQSILWVGGNLTTKSQSGTGTLAGGAQREQEIEITEDDAESLAETINAQLCTPAVKFQFGEDLRARFTLKVAQAVDLAAAIGVDTALVNDLGLKIPESDVRAKYGWRKPDEDEDVIEKAAPAPGTMPGQDTVKVPAPRGLQQEMSGTEGTALKHQAETRNANLETRNTPAELARTLTAAHLAAGREAMDAMVAPLTKLVNEAQSLEEIKAGIKTLQLPTAELQQTFEQILGKAYEAGSNKVKGELEAAHATAQRRDGGEG